MTAKPHPNEAVLARARCYPYPAPERSYTYRQGRADPFEPDLRDGRTPVLAFASNRSPLQLDRKYGHAPETVIPVEQAVLEDFDVVYAASLTRYGAVPAMLQHAPGAAVEIAVTWLDEDELRHMHSTELGSANYHFASLHDVRLNLDTGEAEDTVFVYVGGRGHYAHDGEAQALAAVRCRNRCFPTATTREMLALYHQVLDIQEPLETFIHKVAHDNAYRLACAEQLSTNAIPFSYAYTLIDID